MELETLLEDEERDPEPHEPREEDFAEEAALLAAREAEEELATLREELSGRREREAAALNQFRAALLATEPTMDAALVTGDSFEELHASFAAARASLARVREAVRLEMAARVPTGAPGRSVPPPRTPLEKIREGLSRA